MMMQRLMLALMLAGAVVQAQGEDLRLLHASYFTHSAMFDELNEAFAQYYAERFGRNIAVIQVYDASENLVHNITSGRLEADLVTMTSSVEIDEIMELTGKIDADWQLQQPNNSSPYATATVLLVAKGNPLDIHDWPDLARPGVHIVTANPRTSGFSRYVYYNMYLYAYERFSGDVRQIRNYLQAVMDNTILLTANGQESIAAYESGTGNVMPVWESETLRHRLGDWLEKYDVIYPGVNILCRPRTAVIRGNARKHGSEEAAQEYVQFLFSAQGQEIVARHHLRPSLPSIWKKYQKNFVRIKIMDNKFMESMRDFKRRHFGREGWFEQMLGIRNSHSAVPDSSVVMPRE